MSIQNRLSAALDSANENGTMVRWAVYALVAVVFLFVVPNVVGETFLNLLIRGLIFGLFAMGYDFMYGYSGMVSFGHAALFGVGAYTFSVAFTLFGIQSIWLLLVLSVLMAAVYALVVGTIGIRTREVYFAILTLAFAEVFRILVIQFTDVTGGNDGLVLNLPDWSVVPGLVEISLYETEPFYYVVVVTVGLVYLFLRRLTQSPMGAVLRGIRENIDRLAYIGIDERRYRIIAFVVSGAVSGLAGALYAIDLSFIGPNILVPVQSGEVILWTIIGGQATLIGPVFGGVLIYLVEDTISTIITWWLIPVGIFFVGIIILAPDGIAGLVKRAVGFVKDRR
jgi:branched-chain amino acid transport system permease protein